jgi:Peptidase U49
LLGQRPARRDEELACDAWAHAFLTANVAVYARDHGGDLDSVLSKRCIAAAISIFVLYETTERSGDAGTTDYPPLADRMNATLASTPLERNDKFWVDYACVLVAILRRRNLPLDVNAPNAKQLCEPLVERIRQKS